MYERMVPIVALLFQPTTGLSCKPSHYAKLLTEDRVENHPPARAIHLRAAAIQAKEDD